jgi:phosphoinositide-3-kinase, regulatory subunit 4
MYDCSCVIAELFLEGTSIFSFSDLLRYRSQSYSPNAMLQRIEDEDIRDLIKHMIQIDPSKRYSAADYLKEFSFIFPYYFGTFLYQYVVSLSDSPLSHLQQQQIQSSSDIGFFDNIVQRIYMDFDKIAMTLNLNVEMGTVEQNACLPVSLYFHNMKTDNGSEGAGDAITIPSPDSVSRWSGECGTVILTMICACLPRLSRREYKLMALELILAIGRNLKDSYKLDRCIPFLVHETNDSEAMVRSIACRMISDLLSSVEEIPTSDIDICIEYIFPQLHHLSSDQSVMVRASFASTISTLAESAQRFLEIFELSHEDKVDSYDFRLSELQQLVENEVLTLLQDSSVEVKRCLLQDITNMCLFFGRVKTNEILLSHIITFLNDSDWRLRGNFFEVIVGIGTYLGKNSIDLYIVPLLIQGLYGISFIQRLLSITLLME